jgi:glycosyltransferase involved in cell wall biosynthesis
MPTWNRRPFIRAAIQSFLDQTYENRELVILDDGDDPVIDLIPDDQRIRYIAHKKVTVGKKRNMACEEASGEIICPWDDDDFSMPTRVTDQVFRLIISSKPITGYSTLLFWDRTTRQAKRYRATAAGYVCGTSLAYLRNFWKMRPFRDQQEASDNAFVNPVLRQVAAADGSSHMVARIHDCHHTSSKKGITDVVPKSMIPDRFWDSERLIIP